MIKTLEETILTKIEGAKATTQEKLFKQFVKANTEFERNEIGAKMNVLDSVVFDLMKAVRGNIDKSLTTD